MVVVVHQAAVDGMDKPLGVTSRDSDARFVIGFEVIQVETDLVAFDTGEHAVAHERLGVAAVIAEAVELRLADAPAAAGEVFCRRRAPAGGPVAVTYKAFEDLRFFAADFLDPRVFILEGVVVFGFQAAEEFNGFGPGLGFFHAIETAAHHEFDQVAFATALQAAVTPITKRIVEEQRRLFGRVERTAGNEVSSPTAQGNTQLSRMGLDAYEAGMFLVDNHDILH